MISALPKGQAGSCLTRSPQKPNKAYLLSIRIASPKPFKVSGNIR